ncbi:MAG: ATP-binding protein, partial [Bacteroidales bacterium]|nr:ATP-binding protein [Bacteroidales bacterium]
MLIDRKIEPELKSISKVYPVITITGPRQSGKTTLVKKVFGTKKYVSIEDPDNRELAKTDPVGFLNRFPGGAIFDEIQRAPDILSYIQGIVDEKKKKNMFVLTGSNQFQLLESINQSLAGRTAILKLMPFDISETLNFHKKFTVEDFIYYGFYPAVHSEKIEPVKAYRNYYETYIERDVRQLINIKDLMLFRKFMRLCAGRIGQIFNASQLASETGVSVNTIKSWISILEASYIIYLLPPWFDNISKRLIKSPKLYFVDIGLASYLLGIENKQHIINHPLRGSLFENLILMELVKQRLNNGFDSNFYFFRDKHGNEVDIIFGNAKNL